MQCPECENHFGWDWIEDECIEPNEEFDCPSCGVMLRYTIDEVLTTVLSIKLLKWLMIKPQP